MPKTEPDAAASPTLEADLQALRTTIAAVMDAVIITSADLDAPGPLIEYVNPAFTRLTGYEPQDVVGRSPRLLQGPLTDRAVMRQLREDLEARQIFSGLAINYRKDGSTYTIEWLIAPVRGPDGEVARWVAVQRDVTERDAMQAREVLLVAELQHRVRNVLGAVRTMARQTGEGAASVEDYWAHLDGRMAVLSRLNWSPGDSGSGTDLHRLLLDEFGSHGVTEDRYDLEGPDVRLPAKAAENVALVAHELTTNAIKFGALSLREGRVAVSWQVLEAEAGPRLRLRWVESGGPSQPETTTPGYGAAIIERQAPGALGGEGRLEFKAGGVQCTLEFPLADGAPGQNAAIELHARLGDLGPDAS